MLPAGKTRCEKSKFTHFASLVIIAVDDKAFDNRRTARQILHLIPTLPERTSPQEILNLVDAKLASL